MSKSQPFPAKLLIAGIISLGAIGGSVYHNHNVQNTINYDQTRVKTLKGTINDTQINTKKTLANNQKLTLKLKAENQQKYDEKKNEAADELAKAKDFTKQYINALQHVKTNANIKSINEAYLTPDIQYTNPMQLKNPKTVHVFKSTDMNKMVIQPSLSLDNSSTIDVRVTNTDDKTIVYNVKYNLQDKKITSTETWNLPEK